MEFKKERHYCTFIKQKKTLVDISAVLNFFLILCSFITHYVTMSRPGSRLIRHDPITAGHPLLISALHRGHQSTLMGYAFNLNSPSKLSLAYAQTGLSGVDPGFW